MDDEEKKLDAIKIETGSRNRFEIRTKELQVLPDIKGES
jgi:hypothetical protein